MQRQTALLAVLHLCLDIEAPPSMSGVFVDPYQPEHCYIQQPLRGSQRVPPVFTCSGGTVALWEENLFLFSFLHCSIAFVWFGVISALFVFSYSPVLTSGVVKYEEFAAKMCHLGTEHGPSDGRSSEFLLLNFLAVSFLASKLFISSKKAFWFGPSGSMLPSIPVKASTNSVSDGSRAFDAGCFFMSSSPGSLQVDPC